MLSNPFCFVLQVLAVLQEIQLSQRGCLPGIKQAELLRRYGPEPSPLADYGISSIKSPHTARWPLRPSSVTSHHVSILEATKGREPASHPSGPGSSTTGGMLSNPFCFVLQIINLLPPVRAGCSGSCETTSAHPCDAPIWRVPDLRVSTPWDSLRRGQVTAGAVDDWQAAAPWGRSELSVERDCVTWGNRVVVPVFL
ncbi:hypothetical protein MRX96_031282 [Rhipicephalus microplus]